LTPYQSSYLRDATNRISTVGIVAHASSRRFRLGDSSELRFRYGLDAYHDDVSSEEETLLTAVNRTIPSARPQYVDGATFLTSGAFLDGSLTLWEDLEIHAGSRVALAFAKADGDVATGTDVVDRTWVTPVGRAGISYRWAQGLSTTFNYDQGFRAPNLDDLTARQLVGSGFQFENSDLEAERSHTFELGQALRTDWLSVDLWTFAMLIDDAIARSTPAASECPPEQADCVASRSRVQLANAPGTTFLWGADGGVTLYAPENVTFRTTVGWAWGEQDNVSTDNNSFYGTRVPVSRVPPLNGTVEGRWRHRNTGLYAGAGFRWALAQTRLAPADVQDARIPLGGTPGYAVLDLRMGWRYRRGVQLGVVLENVFDSAYRVHGSSINQAGRGVLATLSVTPGDF
ncbi:MAG: TonB-dependent receptor, partial [Myxococcales bacterium]|nr:TonB-dependent receptor [Myxococcales bacterium]